MTIQHRLARLERSTRRTPSGFSLEQFTLEAQEMRRWLTKRGLTPENALAAGLTGPAGLRFVTLEKIVQVQRDVEEWRRKRFGQ